MLTDILSRRNFSSKHERIKKNILIYGSPKDIELLLHFQERPVDENDNLKLFCCLLLLMLHIKYELTDEKISADLWALAMINDYPKFEKNFCDHF